MTELSEVEIRNLEAQTAKALIETLTLERSFKYTAAADKSRTLDFVGAVGMKGLEVLVDVVRKWTALSDDPITLALHSPGGDTFAGFGIYDFIKEQRAAGQRIDTTCYGFAASMGGILLQAGEDRSMTRNSRLMIHSVSTGFVGSLAELEDQARLITSINEDCYAALAERSTLSVTQIKAKSRRRDWWLSAQEALEFGFIDSIRE